MKGIATLILLTIWIIISLFAVHQFSVQLEKSEKFYKETLTLSKDKRGLHEIK